MRDVNDTIDLYISLKEVEQLIFFKALELEDLRLNIKGRQKDYSVVISVRSEYIIKITKNGLVYFIILMTAVSKIDIVKDDLSLFKNHYNVPKGLLSISDVKVRDVKKGGAIQIDLFDENGYFKVYNSLRNSLVCAYNYAVKEESSVNYYVDWLREFERQGFYYEIIKPHLVLQDIRRVEIKNNYALCNERLLGGLISIKEAVINLGIVCDNQQLAIWIKAVYNAEPYDDDRFQNMVSITTKDLPKELFLYKNFIYYLLFFCVFKDEILNDRKKNTFDIESCDIIESSILYFFFGGMFSKIINKIFYIDKVSSEVFTLEKIAYRYASQLEIIEESDMINTMFYDLKKITIDDKISLVKSYLSLTTDKKEVLILEDISELVQVEIKKKIKASIVVIFIENFQYDENFLNKLGVRVKQLIIINKISDSKILKIDSYSLEFQSIIDEFKKGVLNFSQSLFLDLVVLNTFDNIDKGLLQRDLKRNLSILFKDIVISRYNDFEKKIYIKDLSKNDELYKLVVDCLPTVMVWSDTKNYLYALNE
ncbi:hypothetical protein ACPDHN_16245 [Myroides odoratimimus]|uniref:hypothetical protein n=1 Tax=Myroides odoratimimus TaxID=76832 RepID=UPI003D2F639F